ncbi:head-tail adaptor protein [Pseudomonas protegens]|uniref:head-tail adaptor protein n=1 Tax=Pseudomonas protegens TaxID=380021 RepID=UPI002024D73C|nr:head-tail adaptor protein [Pseudomonas protegens]MCL9653566.1 head-tail adaptor protein [Pseudomonas protegens]
MAMREPSAGEFDRRILIRLRSDKPAANLGVVPVFSTEKQRWAKIEPVGTAVYNAGVQVDNRVTHRVTLYLLAGMSEAHEVVYAGTIYRVRRVAEMNGGRRYTLLEVEELGPQKAGGGVYV